MTPEEVKRRMERVVHVVETMDDHKRELAVQAGLLDRRFAKQGPSSGFTQEFTATTVP